MSNLYELAKEYGATGYHYAWVGQNATTGSANRITGKMSMFGDFYCFATVEDRDDFVDNYFDYNGNKFAKKCNIKTGRQYALGMTQIEHVQHLSMIATN